MSNEDVVCPYCGAKLKKKGWVLRLKKLPGGKKLWRYIEIRKCTSENCGCKHRLIPDDQVPYKHYQSETIEKAIDDDFSEEELLEIEDYPCEATICRWRAWAAQLVKNSEGLIRSKVYDVLDFSSAILAISSSLLEEIKKRIPQGWLAVVLRVIINSGSIGAIPNTT